MTTLTRHGTSQGYDDGDLQIRRTDYIVMVRGTVLLLPRRILFLLFEFADQPCVVRTRADLAEAAWGPVARAVKLQSIDQAVSRLRCTLKNQLPGLTYIHTHAGIGYRFEREPTDSMPRTSNS